MLTIDEIISRINFDMSMVVFTGGEPMLQELEPILEAVQAKKFRHVMAIETNGTIDTYELQTKFKSLWVTCSPKPENMWHYVCCPNELKYVIDGEIKCEDIPNKTNCPVWLQPQGYEMQKSWQKCFEFAMKNPSWRVGVQLHKIMEVR